MSEGQQAGGAGGGVEGREVRAFNNPEQTIVFGPCVSRNSAAKYGFCGWSESEMLLFGICQPAAKPRSAGFTIRPQRAK